MPGKKFTLGPAFGGARRWMKPNMKVKANGISINYQIDGPEHAPWLVFSNSLATSLSMWDEQAAALKDRFRVLRYDQRGHGGTDAPAGRYAFDTLLDDALALMDALGIAKANFSGLSMGGATALGLAERRSDRFERIIGAEARHRGFGRADRLALVSARDDCEQSALSRQNPRHDPRHSGQRFRRLRGGACRSRLCVRGSECEVPNPVHRRREGRRHSGRHGETP